MAWPAVKRGFTQEGLRSYVAGLAFGIWRPSLIVWHNTAAPTLAQWHASGLEDAARDKPPGTTRIGNLESYFRGRGWSGAPHLFIADDLIWVFNPLDKPGVHSPSWNAVSIGIEMIGDYDREDDDAGAGLKVKNNCIFATALLCETFGLLPRSAVRLHREDPNTTHKCPGNDLAVDKAPMIAAVEALLAGGEHAADDVAVAIGAAGPAPPPEERSGRVTVDGLNVRRGPSASSEIAGSLDTGTPVAVLEEARNGATGWLKVRTPAGFVGWVAGRYVATNP